MADRLSASQMAIATSRHIRAKVSRTATIDNDAISATDISSRVTKWGSIQFKLFNRYPGDKQGLQFPVLTLEVDNHDGYFDMGGTVWPNGQDDVEGTTLRVQVEAMGSTWLDFTGLVLEPEYSDSKIIGLVAEHPLTAMTQRKWLREDRIGGDTGYDIDLDS